MKNKNLFYTVEKQTHDIDGFEECTGLKTITVYEIIDNQPKIFCEIEAENINDSESEIQVWLDENGYEDEEFNFTIL